jgi:hypothetical protein
MPPTEKPSAFHTGKPSGECIKPAAPRYRFCTIVMVDPSTPASTKVRAADSVLNHTAKAIEIQDLDARLSALEEAAPPENRKR